MPKPDHRSQMARAWLHFHAARKGRGSGSAAPRVDRPVYPRRAEHNTVAERGNRRSAIASSSQISLSPRSLVSFSYLTLPSGSVEAVTSNASALMAMRIIGQEARPSRGRRRAWSVCRPLLSRGVGHRNGRQGRAAGLRHRLPRAPCVALRNSHTQYATTRCRICAGPAPVPAL